MCGNSTPLLCQGLTDPGVVEFVYPPPGEKDDVHGGQTLTARAKRFPSQALDPVPLNAQPDVLFRQN